MENIEWGLEGTGKRSWNQVMKELVCLSKELGFCLTGNRKSLMVFKLKRMIHIMGLREPSCGQLYLGRLCDLCLGTGNDTHSREQKETVALGKRRWQKLGEIVEVPSNPSGVQSWALVLKGK